MILYFDFKKIIVIINNLMSLFYKNTENWFEFGYLKITVKYKLAKFE